MGGGAALPGPGSRPRLRTKRAARAVRAVGRGSSRVSAPECGRASGASHRPPSLPRGARATAHLRVHPRARRLKGPGWVRPRCVCDVGSRAPRTRPCWPALPSSRTSLYGPSSRKGACAAIAGRRTQGRRVAPLADWCASYPGLGGHGAMVAGAGAGAPGLLASFDRVYCAPSR